MNLKVLFLPCLIVALISSESDAQRDRVERNRPGKNGGNCGHCDGGSEKRQVEKWCNSFEDNASVFTACSQLTENVESYMEQTKNDAKTYMEQQKAILEDVVKTACSNLNEDEEAMTCNGNIKANICSNLLEDEEQ